MLDPLTGLSNRTQAYERIDQGLARARRDGTSMAVFLLDIDDFKIINDSLPAPRPEAIVAAIVMLARAFGLTVVGEGVETVEQLESLRACGCDLAQGFLLGKPMTAAQATIELRKSEALKAFYAPTVGSTADSSMPFGHA
jgi:predicted signal transduction protein with EAL and GGDEF domain